jgi:hypothetical protein
VVLAAVERVDLVLAVLVPVAVAVCLAAVDLPVAAVEPVVKVVVAEAEVPVATAKKRRFTTFKRVILLFLLDRL